jgi:hypothetical protein
MNLYLLSQNYNPGYDTYDSCIVAAETKEDATTIHPDKDHGNWVDGAWVSIDKVKCVLIGTAIHGTKRGVILASFNAG